jgi:hypothetical protein
MYSAYVGKGYKTIHIIYAPDEEVNFTAEDVVKYMANLGYVNHAMYRPGSPSCMLDAHGIEHIEPTYFEKNIMVVLERLYTTNSRQNINELLQFPPEHLDRSNEVAKVMEQRDLIQAVQVTRFGYVAEISPNGRDYYERKKAEFLN